MFSPPQVLCVFWIALDVLRTSFQMMQCETRCVKLARRFYANKPRFHSL